MPNNPPYPPTTYPPTLVAMVIKYDGLLQRYARRLVGNDTLASIIVLQAFQSYYEKVQLPNDDVELRKGLQEETLSGCKYWLKYHQVKLLRDPQNKL